MEDKANRSLVADPKLRHLAVCKLWAELYVAHRTDNVDLCEELEYQALMLMTACQEVLKLLAAHHLDEENHNP